MKTALLVDGARLTEAARRVLIEWSGGRLTSHEYPTTGGLTLELTHGVLVNTPVDEWFCDRSSHTIDVQPGLDTLIVRSPGAASQPVVAVLPLPGYLDATDESGRSVVDTCFSHADRIRLSPIVGCAYRCDYCDLPAQRYRRRDSDQLLDAFAVALDDRHLPPRHVLISGGSPSRAHLGWFESVIADVVAASPLPVDVMMSAVPHDIGLVDRLVDIGVSGFSVNLELYSGEASELHILGKHRHARPGFEAFVGRAVERLGSGGRVRSLVVAGLEPLEATLAGVELIASLGADPVVSPFRPAELAGLGATPPPPATMMGELLTAARSIAGSHGVHLGPDCVPCQHNTLSFPWDARTTV